MCGTMKAIVKKESAYGAVLMEMPIPEIKDHEVLIKVKATSICGTDVHIYNWDDWAKGRVKAPYIFGHEFTGEVVKVGKQVSRVKVGDFVSAETHVVCNQCYMCLTGQQHLCSETKILGVDIDGCFAEYVKIPEQNVWHNPAQMPVELASIQEPLGNAVHTVLHTPVSGKSVAIFGCGPIGLMAIAVAKASGAVQVFAVDKNEYRLDLARKMGADHIVDIGKDDPVAMIKQLTRMEGADVMCEMSGHPAAINQALEACANGGKVNILSLPERPVTIDITNQIVFRGLTVQGITGRKMFETWRQVSELLRTNTIDVKPVVTHTLPFEEFEKGFELMRNGTCGKVVLMMPSYQRGKK
ncbi:L-threonine 3-dehydrogenase [Bacillus safensis]|uniref:L-threonine 3-dehydrogenase n=1 Tax=Bacillus safensis TaxID=561879 RepID=UPI002EB4FC95|nr:L-threonine 3-dehydrogenase [Bacillus safensis]